MRGDDLVVGTAGHIDHGKTSLVRALTGVDLDALPEERERGITIALGFTSLELGDGRLAAFVDVPGHERLVRTMIAGATGIDAVLLCVSAVDGVMPQTREHLAILGLLGVTHGAVVLTMADLVDDDLLELAVEDVRDVTTGTFLEGAPIVPFSAIDLRGRDDVVAAVRGFQRAPRRLDGPFRLPVDRAFVRQGFGTVVTGTAWSGVLKDGAQVTLLPRGREARVRGLQVHGRNVEEVPAGSRAAVNLAGVDKSEVPRGTVVAVGAVPCPHMIDVRYTQLEAAGPLPDGSPVRVLLGTAECMGRLHVAEDREEVPAGITVVAQLRLENPMPCLRGDRFVLRRTSPLETLGGGVVVDPYAARMKHKHREAWGAAILRLAKGDLRVWLERAGEEGLTPAAWAERGGDGGSEELGGMVFAPRVVARLKGALLEALEQFHASQPLSRGANRRELRRGRLAHLSERVFDAVVERLARRGNVVVVGPLVRLAGFEVALSDAQAALRVAVLQAITRAGLAGLDRKALHEALPQPEVGSLTALLESEEAILPIAGLGLVATSELVALRGRLAAWFAEHDVLTPGDFKELTGLSRKGAIPLLEWLDKSRLTRREGDSRVRGAALD